MEDLDKKTQERNEAFTKVLTEMLEPHIPAIQIGLVKFGQWLEKVKTDLAPLLLKIAQTDWKAVQARLESMPARSREVMSRASAQGWFFNWENSLEEVLNLIESLQTANTDEVDEILKTHYTKDMDWYVIQLANAYPDRKQAIAAAVNAHKNYGTEGYYISIPVFLAQADGIFSEITGITSAMDKVRNSDVIKGSAWVQNIIGDNEEVKDLLYQLLNLHTMDILKSKGQRDKESREKGKIFDALNRHQVMHGEVSNYGTELNSFKAFSFLAFIGLHVPGMLNSPRLRHDN
jgi:hypothetical protein